MMIRGGDASLGSTLQFHPSWRACPLIPYYPEREIEAQTQAAIHPEPLSRARGRAGRTDEQSFAGSKPWHLEPAILAVFTKGQLQTLPLT